MPKACKYLILLSYVLMGKATLNTLHAQEVPELAIGGALRFNYNLSSWKPAQKVEVGILDMIYLELTQKQPIKAFT